MLSISAILVSSELRILFRIKLAIKRWEKWR